MRNIPFGKPIIGDEERSGVLQVLQGSTLVHGPVAEEFERKFAEFTRARHAVSLSSCTAGLHLSYFYLGLKAGDEVIVPAQTHTATAHAVEFCNATPIFVDAERQTGNIDIDQVEERITERTKAISVVHYLGMPVNMDRINSIAKRYGLFVVEDCALAMGTYFSGAHAGTLGDVGCFSFYPVKHITTAEGGMLTTASEEIAIKIRRQKAFGVDRTVGERAIPGVYDVTLLGYNYRMNELEAALGLAQLQRIPTFLHIRKENYENLTARLKYIDEINLLESSHDGFHSSYYCQSVLLKDRLVDRRFDIVNYLREHGIGTSIYYPKPVPHLLYYKAKYRYTNDSFPVAAWISQSSIALPVGPHLNVEDMEYIGETLKNAIQEVNKR